MKTFSKLNETAGNVGNNLANTGVSNHYTPVDNILTNIRNLFCTRLSIFADKGEDNVSIKLSSSKFFCEKSIDDLLYLPLYNDAFSQSNLYNYITSQGLQKVSKINLGSHWIVYFSPNDIATAKIPAPIEANESLLDEFEISTIIKEDDSEEEIKDITLEKILELVDAKDKVKAAKQIELLIAQQIELPREYYFAAIKFKTGEEAIALRWKYTKKMPKGKSTENTRSILYIFGKGDDGIWVQDFAKDSMVKLPDDVETLIKSVLDILEAKETDDPSIFKLDGERKERETKKDKDDEDKDDDKKKDDKDKEDNKDKSDEDDEEDDDSRGDKSDDLLG